MLALQQVPMAGATGTLQMSGQLSSPLQMTSHIPQSIGDKKPGHMTPNDQTGPTMMEKASGRDKQERGHPS